MSVYIQADFFQRKSNIFPGYKNPPVRTSDQTIPYRSDLRYVPMLGMFLSYERSLLWSFGSPGLRGDLKIKVKTFPGSVANIFQGMNTSFPERMAQLFQGGNTTFPGRETKLFQGWKQYFSVDVAGE